MSTSSQAFDAIRFKETTRAQWQQAADAWHRWGGLLGTWLGPSTERMLDLGHVAPGSRVLDVAAGAGEQSMVTARRVGPSGRVLATDLSSNILRLAQQSADDEGLTQLETLELDGERLDQLPAASFDAVISRVGMIYFPDQLKALRGMHHALAEGGYVSLITYSTAEKNRFFSDPVSIIRRRAQLPPPLPGQPGPFSLGDPQAIRELLEQAGFREVVVETVDAPVVLETSDECLAFEKESFGALHQMMSSLDANAQVQVWDEVAESLRAFEGPDGFRGPCELHVAAGRK